MLKKVFIATLGCPKNDVDSEVLARFLSETGWIIVDALDDAEIAIVNTCGFIESAKKESIEAIWEMVTAKENGLIGKVVVTGCLAERYGDALVEEIPQLDAVLGNRDMSEIPGFLAEAIHTGNRVYRANPANFSCDWYERPTGHSHPAWAYLKISEGCDNACCYCAIPRIRGPLRSVPIESLLRQAQYIIDSGAREIVIIGQDTTAYGHDIGKKLFPELIKRLSDIEGDFWIRVLYAHPKNLDTDNIKALTETPKVVPYLELPIQHFSDPILERMGREVTSAEIREKVAILKELRPDIALRTSVIVGFPGETDDDFNRLADYIEEGYFCHGGVFEYSEEDGTIAASYSGKIPKETSETRKHLIEMIFDRVICETNRRMEELTMPVLIENAGIRPGLLWGRTQYDAPQIDRMVRVRGNASVGEIVDVNIIRGTEYHLLGVQE